MVFAICWRKRFVDVMHQLIYFISPRLMLGGFLVFKIYLPMKDELHYFCGVFFTCLSQGS